MVEEKGSFEGVKVRNVIRFDSCNVAPKVKSIKRRGGFLFSASPVCSEIFSCHLDLHQMLRDDFAD